MKSKKADSMKTYDSWNAEDEKLLVELWGENHSGLESRESRKYWQKTAEGVNAQFSCKLSIPKLTEKCQKKIRYLLK